MVPRPLIDETVARYQQRAPERQQHDSRLSAGSPITADTPERVQKRIARLAIGETSRGVMPGIPTPGFGATPAANVLERIIGRNDLMSVSFLEGALAAARTVSRIRIRAGRQTIGYGTGSLVGPRVLLTNNHVLESPAAAAASLAEFNYQDGVQVPTVFELDPDSLFVTDRLLDYTLVAVRERDASGVEIASFGFNRLIEQEGKVLIGECLNIIQHPNGELKQIALRENQLRDILDNFLHYHTDTAPGSSGSPVFNDEWELVALHHSGVPRTDPQGRYLTKDGLVWEPAMGEHRIDWTANEGARVSRIVAHLKRQALSGVARSLRDSVLDGRSSAAPAAPATQKEKAAEMPPAIAPGERIAAREVRPVEAPVQFDRAQFGLELVEVDNLVRAAKARALYKVDGSGLAVAVLDTGLRTTHVDFAGRVAAQRNFTPDNGGDPADASDGNGHGTNVTGIIAAGGIHTGMAPQATVIPLKVLRNNGSGSFASILDALRWVSAHREEHGITAVCMSLGDGGNYQTDDPFAGDAIRAEIAELRRQRVAVVVAAGNDYFTHRSEQGMGYPAIFRETISVGAVYDFDEGPFSYGSGAQAFSTAPDRITPFSQRLHQKVHAACRTDIFAPGAPVTSSGINNDTAESVQHGTSQATPVTVGIILLLQQYFKSRTGQLPSVDRLEGWMRSSARRILDGDDEHDNVVHTGLRFLRLDAVRALETGRRALQKAALESARPLEAVAESAAAYEAGV